MSGCDQGSNDEVDKIRVLRRGQKKFQKICITGLTRAGSGKTRFWLKPNLLQMHSSYVVTDPKGSVLVECGNALLHGAPKLDEKGNPLKDKNGKVIREPYVIKVFNTINFKKSMKYNPFAYIHSEKDILKLVTALIANTKGEGKAGDEFWTKAETLLYTALIGYIHYRCCTCTSRIHCAIAVSAERFGRNPFEFSLNFASQIGSMTCKTHCWTMRSMIVGIPSGLIFPLGFGISTRLTGRG